MKIVNRKKVETHIVCKSEMGVGREGRRSADVVQPKLTSSSSFYDPVEEKQGRRDEIPTSSTKEDNASVEEEILGDEFTSELKSYSDDPAMDELREAVNRLEQVMLVSEEPELSEEQLMINEQSQLDELLVIEAIYGDNLTVFRRGGGQRAFQINIHIETPDELAISAKLSSNEIVKFGGKSTSLRSTDEGSDELFYTIQIQHLHPIVLTCLLPKSYPSHRPPYFSISVQWLDSLRITDLCNMLDSSWTAQSGQEIIHEWVNLLHSSLYFLGSVKELILGPYNTPYAEDSRAISKSVSPGVDMQSIMSYNDETLNEYFRENIHECCICFSEHAGTEFIILPCKHFFCWKCMETYSRMHVKEGTINKLLCPEEKCGEFIPPSLLERLLGNEQFARWESLLLQKTLETMSDVAYCPRCETACLKDEEHHAQCPMCFFSFCSRCRERRHVGLTCTKPEIKLQILKDRQVSSQLDEKQRRIEQQLINDILSYKAISQDSKQCPSCKMAIFRNGGCNHMDCRNCGQPFCYECNEPLNQKHQFGVDGCPLFSPATIREWENHIKQKAEGYMIRRRLSELSELRMNEYHVALASQRPCRICQKMNAKVRNDNRIICQSCRNQYCYQCGENIGRNHYGPKGCRRHE